MRNIILSTVVVLAVIGALVYVSIKNKTNPPENNDMNNTIPQDNASTGENSGQAAQTGQTGQVAKAGDIVSMNYTGRLTDGKVFDSNVDPKFGHVQPFE